MKATPASDACAPTLVKDLFDFLLEHTPDQIYFKDRQGRFICVSRAVAEYMHVANPEDLIGKSDFDFWSPETAREAAADEKRIMETGEPMVGKIERLVHPDQSVTWDYTTKLPLRDSAGRTIGICGINKDFTAIKQMEDALSEERNRLRITTAELEAKNAQLEADLQLAREVQEALLPREYPIFPGHDVAGRNALSFAHCYRPASAVGGDFFDFFSVSPTRAGIFICDVMGHGLRAALITAVIRALLEELRPQMGVPGAFLSALNQRLRIILDRLDEPFVATACYIVADIATNEVAFANAGHPDPLLFRRTKKIVEPLKCTRERGGPGLGLFDEIAYRTTRCSFDCGDCIVLFTDGLYEVYSPQGEEFGRSALESSFRRHADLRADKLFNAVLKDVSEFSSRQDFDDDVCMVAIDRCPE